MLQTQSIYGQESPGWISLFKLITFSLLKIYRTVIFLVKLIGQWIPDGDGRGMARDIKKNYCHFQNLTENGDEVGTIYKIGTLLCISAF